MVAVHYVSETNRNVYTSLNADRMLHVIAHVASETAHVSK